MMLSCYICGQIEENHKAAHSFVSYNQLNPMPHNLDSKKCCGDCEPEISSTRIARLCSSCPCHQAKPEEKKEFCSCNNRLGEFYPVKENLVIYRCQNCKKGIEITTNALSTPEQGKECKHLNAAGFRWINDNCLSCGADLNGCAPKKEKELRKEWLDIEANRMGCFNQKEKECVRCGKILLDDGGAHSALRMKQSTLG